MNDERKPRVSASDVRQYNPDSEFAIRSQHVV